MKKILLLAVMMTTILLANEARADWKDWLSKVPTNRSGITYNIDSSEIDYVTTFEAIAWKGLSGEIGYSNDNDKLVLVGSYELLRLRDKINLPILNLVVFRPGVWMGWENLNLGKGSDNNNDFSWGISFTALEVKF